jgi:hypothetical protein
MKELLSSGFVSLDTAEKLKNIGYDIPINMVLRKINFYCESMDSKVRENPANWIEYETILPYSRLYKSYRHQLGNGATKEQLITPLIELHLAQKWFREKHKLHVTICSLSQYSWIYGINHLEDISRGESCTGSLSSYEEALNGALNKMCNLI